MFVLPRYNTATELTETTIISIRHEQKKRQWEDIQIQQTSQRVKPKSQICK